MAKATATALAHLVIIDTQAGPQPQIWYADGGQFVGTGGIEPAESHPLPNCILSRLRNWRVDDAIRLIALNQKETNSAS